MDIIHHGAKDGVTGSCHQLYIGNSSLLIDCGLFQGDEVRSLDIEFPIDDIEALLVTHTHIDHIGRIPWLIAAGFRSPIYCTRATAALIPLMLDDGLRLQLGLHLKERERILRLIKSLLIPIDYGIWHSVPFTTGSKIGSKTDPELEPELEPEFIAEIRFQPAGHILGSSYIEIKLPTDELVVFSGDLGPCHTPLLPDPISPQRADVLIIESTYGDKKHEAISERAARLKRLIARSLQDGGVILIPAFSVGRTQELLFDIEALFATSLNELEKREWSTLPIILDSPMAAKVTEQYRGFKSLWSAEAKERLSEGRHPLAFDQCITIETHRDHLALVNRLQHTGEPAIIVSASGMCNGGRILNYLEALLPDPRTDVILAGYQARGTIGREIQNGAKEIEIDGRNVDVNAHIHSMSGYSAHADQVDLLAFIEGIKEKPKQIRVVHGDKGAQREFAKLIRDRGLCDEVYIAAEAKE